MTSRWLDIYPISISQSGLKLFLSHIKSLYVYWSVSRLLFHQVALLKSHSKFVITTMHNTFYYVAELIRPLIIVLL